MWPSLCASILRSTSDERIKNIHARSRLRKSDSLAKPLLVNKIRQTRIPFAGKNNPFYDKVFKVQFGEKNEWIYFTKCGFRRFPFSPNVTIILQSGTLRMIFFFVLAKIYYRQIVFTGEWEDGFLATGVILWLSNSSLSKYVSLFPRIALVPPPTLPPEALISNRYEIQSIWKWNWLIYYSVWKGLPAFSHISKKEWVTFINRRVIILHKSDSIHEPKMLKISTEREKN